MKQMLDYIPFQIKIEKILDVDSFDETLLWENKVNQEVFEK